MSLGSRGLAEVHTEENSQICSCAPRFSQHLSSPTPQGPSAFWKDTNRMPQSPGGWDMDPWVIILDHQLFDLLWGTGIYPSSFSTTSVGWGQRRRTPPLCLPTVSPAHTIVSRWWCSWLTWGLSLVPCWDTALRGGRCWSKCR